MSELSCEGCKWYKSDPMIIGDCSQWFKEDDDTHCLRITRVADHYEPKLPDRPKVPEKFYPEYDIDPTSSAGKINVLIDIAAQHEKDIKELRGGRKE